MASTLHIILLLATATLTTSTTFALNLTSLLSPFPDLSIFTTIFTPSFPTITSSLTNRTSLTILTVPNAYFSDSSPSRALTHRLPPPNLADILRYHILLQFLSAADLRRLPSSGTLFPTLLQSTGRSSGLLNLTSSTAAPPSSDANATVLEVIKSYPYNITIVSINTLLVPYDFNLMASETRPSLNLNITEELIDGHNFNVAASMLQASGVIEEFERDEAGAGITLFVPTDLAFAGVNPEVNIQSLTAEKKAVVLKYHVLHSYYPLGSLESIVNPLQPTLATEDRGAGRFTLNISRVNGSVLIDSGIVQASVTQTVFDQNPVAIFGVSKVLLPKEIFGDGTSSGGGDIEGAAPPPLEMAEAPGSWQPQHLSPGERGEVGSDGEIRGGVQSFWFVLFCIGMYLVMI